MRRLTLGVALIAIMWLATALAGDEPPRLFNDGSRVVFLGDSITYDGRYTHYLEAHLLVHHPERQIECINVGLPSEGVTGLTEPAHPFPRPNLHERLSRVLDQLQPDLVIACYGMNDGIYHPFSEERFAAYQAGMEKLIAQVTSSGAKLIVITPPPFDPLPVRDKLRDASAGEFSWVHPYRDYDAVLARYSQWLLHMNDPRLSAVVDARTPTIEHLRWRRQAEPQYTLAADGVHTNAAGQWLIARAVLEKIGCGQETLAPDAGSPQLLRLVGERQELLGRAWLTHIGHERPNTPPGEPLEQATAKAGQLHEQARQIARSVGKP